MIVVVITILMLGLILGPVVQTFNLTSRAQKQIEAQDAARATLERISRELAEAVFVYDNTSHAVNMQVYDAAGNPTVVPVYQAVIDFVPPKMGCRCVNPEHPDGEPRDFPRGDEASPTCPVCGSSLVELRPLQPLQPDTKIVRYFIALRDPTEPYSSPFATGLVEATKGDNPYLLYRAEFDPWDTGLCRRLGTGQPDLQNPDFFYDDQTGPNWQKISRVVGPAKDIDMIVSGLTKNGQLYVRPLVRFTPTPVLNDALTPTYVTDIGSEVPTASKEFIPTVYRAASGHWTPDYVVRVLRDGFTTEYFTAYNSQSPPHMCIYKRQPGGSRLFVFDITLFQQTGAFKPPKPELMFNVDTKNGEVGFAMPGREEILSSTALNDAFLDQFDAEGFGQRYHRLRYVVNPDTADYIPNARIIPGSEEIIGPDAQAGPNYGKPIRYQRVPFAVSDPGRNQYKIDYRTGEIWFASRYDEPLPPGTNNIIINYKFSNNKADDVVRADYTTKNLITISMQIRMYDPPSGKAQSIELSNKVRVNNTVR